MNHCMVLALLMPNLRKGGNLYAAVTSELVPIDHRGFGTSVNFDYSVFFSCGNFNAMGAIKKNNT